MFRIDGAEAARLQLLPGRADHYNLHVNLEFLLPGEHTAEVPPSPASPLNPEHYIINPEP